MIDLPRDRKAAKAHLDKALELAEADDSLASERAHVLVLLGDVADAAGAKKDAVTYYRSAIDDLLEVLGRRIERDVAGVARP